MIAVTAAAAVGVMVAFVPVGAVALAGLGAITMVARIRRDALPVLLLAASLPAAPFSRPAALMLFYGAASLAFIVVLAQKPAIRSAALPFLIWAALVVAEATMVRPLSGRALIQISTVYALAGIWTLYGATVGLRQAGAATAAAGIILAGVVLVTFGLTVFEGALSLAGKREFASFVSPNAYGAFAAIALVIVLVAAARSWAHRATRTVGACAYVLIVIVTFSRAAVLALAAVLLTALLLRRVQRAVRPAIVFRLAFAGMLVACAVVAYWVVSNPVADDESDLLRGRTELWEIARAATAENWPLGIGYERSIELKRSYGIDPESKEGAGGFHSAYWQEALAHGLAGVAILACAAVYGSWRIARATERANWPEIGLLLVIFVFGGVRALAESNGWIVDSTRNAVSPLLWLAFGIANQPAVRSLRQRGAWHGSP